MSFKYKGRKILKKFGKKWRVIGTARDKKRARQLVNTLKAVSRVKR